MFRSIFVRWTCVFAIGVTGCAAGPAPAMDAQERDLTLHQSPVTPAFAAYGAPAAATPVEQWGAVIGSGRRVQEERPVSAFSRIEASTGVTVDITIGEPRVVVEADDNIVPYIRTRVSSETLIIDVDTTTSVSSVSPLAVHVVVPTLKSASAAVGSILSVKDITAKELTLEADSGSNVQASGTVDHLEATATVGGVISARDLKAKQVVVSANIGSTLTVTAIEDVSGTLDFGSIAHVSGHPAHQSVVVTIGSSLTLD